MGTAAETSGVIKRKSLFELFPAAVASAVLAYFRQVTETLPSVLVRKECDGSGFYKEQRDHDLTST